MKHTRIKLIPILLGLYLLAACSPSLAEQPVAASETATSEARLSLEGTATPTLETFQMPEGSLLVFTNQGDGGGEYSLVNLADLSVEPYAPLNSDKWFFDWSYVLSPDASYFAYRRSVNQEYSVQTLYVLDIDDGESTMVSDYSRSNGIPTWTADGRYLAFDKYDQGIFIYDVETGDLRRIAVSSEFSDSSSISPSGDRIAYKGGCPGPVIACPVDLYMINSDGSGEQALLEGAMLDWIFWSADGRVIYFSMFGDPGSYGNAGSGYKLYALDVESGLAHLIADPQFQTSAFGSSFLSPNGEFLAYNFGDAGLQIITTSDNSDVAFLPSGIPTWSPDSRYILINSWEGAGQVELFDLQTGQSTIIEIENPAGSQIVGWLP